jgi:leucyl/phenylalanyl-tRNA--protein transferase
VALVHLVGLLTDDGRPRLLEVQWTTPHLVSLGAVDVPRRRYLELLGAALEQPLPAAFRT